VKKVSGGTTTLYFYDKEGKLIEEYIPATAAGKDYLWMPKSYEPVAKVDFSMTDADTGDVLRCSKSSPNVHLDWSLFSGGGNFVMRRGIICNFSAYSNIFGPSALKACDDPVLGNTTSYWYDTRDRSLTDTLYFYHSDHLGTAIILLDASGNIVYKQHYAPFGQKDKANTDKRPSTCNNGEEKDSFPYGFTGHFGDEESGLIYMGARYYNPAIGHFMTPDNVLPSPTDSLSYDRYAYTRNNPINLIDPTGNFAWAAFWIYTAIGAAVGATVAAIQGGNILLGAVTGAISGALTTLGAPLGMPGQWTYLAVTQTVNVALHATSGGQWVIGKAGDAIGSQVLGDIIVTALATGVALKAFGPKLPSGADVKPGQEAGQATVQEMKEKITSLGEAEKTATGEACEQIEAEIEQWNEAVTAANTMRPTANSGYGEDIVEAISSGRITILQKTAYFNLKWSDNGNLLAIDVKSVGFSAPVQLPGGVSAGPTLAHTSVSWIDSTVSTRYPDWTWGTVGSVCHQTSAKALSQLLGVTVSPFALTANWSAMLSVGLYGYWGSWGGIFIPTAQSYVNREAYQ